MSIQNYLPIKLLKSSEAVLVAGRVPINIVNKVRAIMKKECLSWSEVLTACLIAFLDERGIKVKE
jgi:hypothetical protein